MEDMLDSLKPKLKSIAAEAKKAADKAAAEAKKAREKIVSLARNDLWSSDESTLANALDQLTSFCEDDSEDAEACRRALLETGVHALVVKVLERNPTSAVLQGKGLEVLFL